LRPLGERHIVDGFRLNSIPLLLVASKLHPTHGCHAIALSRVLVPPSRRRISPVRAVGASCTIRLETIIGSVAVPIFGRLWDTVVVVIVAVAELIGSVASVYERLETVGWHRSKINLPNPPFEYLCQSVDLVDLSTCLCVADECQ
jgi:hypothetical protein